MASTTEGDRPRTGGSDVARRVIVTGRVQGVFFRDACARQARGAGVAGWVRNRRDGAVEAWFEGPPQAVDKLVRWCRQGSPQAEVSGIEVIEDSPARLEGFRIQ